MEQAEKHYTEFVEDDKGHEHDAKGQFAPKGQGGEAAPKEDKPAAEPKEKKKYGKTKAEVVPRSDWRNSATPIRDVHDAAEHFFGKRLTSREIASLAGAPDDTKVFVKAVGEEKNSPDGIEVTIRGGKAKVQADRRIAKDAHGKTYIENEYFWVAKEHQGSGVGTDVLAREIENAQENGVSYIQTHAAGWGPAWVDSGDRTRAGFNGYYTWPRLGYDQPVETLDRDVKEKVREEFPQAKSILDIMSTKHGRDWWKENGDDLEEAKFDLKPGSRSMQVFSAYLEERAQKATAHAEDQDDEPNDADLSADEDAALERVWKKIEEEGWKEPEKAKPEKHAESGHLKLFSESPTDFSAFKEVPLKPLIPEKAVAFFKLLLPKLGIDPERFGLAMRRHAFTLAAAIDQQVLEAVQNAIGTRLESGEASTGPQAIQEILKQSGVSPDNPQYAEMVWRTNVMDAYAEGADEERQDPDVKDFFPAWRYIGIRDGRQRKQHEVHFDRYYPNDMTFAEVRDSEYGGEFSGFNCRCSQIPIDRYEWAKLQAQGITFATLRLAA